MRQVEGTLENEEAFAKASNRQDAAPLTAETQAAEDAEALTDEIFEGFSFGKPGGSNRQTIAQILADPSDQNHRAFVKFVNKLVQSARSRYRHGDTEKFSPEARHLFENVVFHRVFAETERGQALFELKENGTLAPTQNGRALMIILPHLAKFDAFFTKYRDDVRALSISKDVAAAFHLLSTLRGDPYNMRVGQAAVHLDTMPMADDPTMTETGMEIARALNGIKDVKSVANIIINYIGKAIETVEASGVPVAQQDAMFEGGDVYTGPSKDVMLTEIIEESKKPKKKTEDTGQTDLFPEGEEGDTDAREPGTPARGTGTPIERSGTGDNETPVDSG